MQDRPNEQDTDDQQVRLDFEAKRANLKSFFETQQLRNLVKEFFEKQQIFHEKMHNFVQSCGEVSGQLSNEQQQLLEGFLHPYGVLIANPFEEKPSGDLEKDILHIFGVINERNAHFTKILPAMFLSAINLKSFHLLIAEVRKNQKIAEIILSGIKSKSWLDVEGHVDLPFQNLMRYKLLLDAIRAELVKAHCSAVEPVLMNIMNALSYIMPELKHINLHHDTLMLLNEIDLLVVELAKQDAKRTPGVAEATGAYLTFENQVAAVRLYIDSARANIAKGKEDVVDILLGLLQMLELLQQDTDATLAIDKQTYYSRGYELAVGLSSSLFGENTLFGKPLKDPRERLHDSIGELRTKHGQIELIRMMETMALASKPSL